MPERLERLRTLLDELEAELRAVQELDDGTRTRLEEASGEIRTALDRGDPEEFEPHSLIEGLQEAVEEFEASHPSLTRFVTRLVDGLGQMGI